MAILYSRLRKSIKGEEKRGRSRKGGEGRVRWQILSGPIFFFNNLPMPKVYFALKIRGLKSAVQNVCLNRCPTNQNKTPH